MPGISKKKIKEEIVSFKNYIEKLTPNGGYDIPYEVRDEIKIFRELGKLLDDISLDWDKETVMAKLAKYSHVPKLIETFLALGAKVNSKVDNSSVPLIIAFQNKFKADIENIKLLVKETTDINKKDGEGKTALHWACYSYGPVTSDIVRFLLENGAELNVTDNFGKSPLHYACREFSILSADIVKLLIDYGADINVVDDSGNSVLTHAVKSDDVQKVTILLESGAKVKIDEHLNCKDEPEILKKLIEYGCDINLKNSDGKTLFFTKIERPFRNTEGFLNVFLDAGVDINEQDSDGKTVLFHLFENGRELNLISTLLKNGASLNIKNRYGQPAFHYIFRPTYDLSRQKEYLECIEYLCKNTNIDLNMENSHGRTIVDYVVFNGDLYSLKRLLELGAKINKTKILPELKGYIDKQPDFIRDTDYSFISKSDFSSTSTNHQKGILKNMYDFILSIN